MLEPEAQELLDAVAALARDLPHDLGERPMHYQLIVGLYDRAASTFGAIRSLLRSGFAHEAVALTRPLFTSSLVLQELAAADEPTRAELMVGWWLLGLAERQKIVRALERHDDATPAEAAEVLQALAEHERQLRDYASRRGVAARHWEPNEMNLARRHGREAEAEIDLRAMHLFVHPSAFGTQQRAKRVDNAVEIGGCAVDLETWGAPAGYAGARSYLHAVESISTIVGCDRPPQFSALWDKVTAAYHTLNAR